MNKIPKYIGVLNKESEWGAAINSLIPEYKGVYLNAGSSSLQPENDHQFVIVDLLKMHNQWLIINNANMSVPLTAKTTQSNVCQFGINAVSAVTAVIPVTTDLSFSATNITVNEEVYSNANQ